MYTVYTGNDITHVVGKTKLSRTSLFRYGRHKLIKKKKKKNTIAKNTVIVLMLFCNKSLNWTIRSFGSNSF